MCDLTGDGFVAKVNAPAVVNLLSYGTRTKPLGIDCLVGGKEHSLKVEPANLSANNRSANAVGAGVLFGAVVGGAMAAAAIGARVDDAYGYGPIKIKFNYLSGLWVRAVIDLHQTRGVDGGVGLGRGKRGMTQ